MRNFEAYELNKLRVEFRIKSDMSYLQIHYENNLVAEIPLGIDTSITNQFKVFNNWLLQNVDPPLTDIERKYLYNLIEPIYDKLLNENIDIRFIMKACGSNFDKKYISIVLPNGDTLQTFFLSTLPEELQFKTMVRMKPYTLQNLKLDRFKEEKIR